MDLRAVTDPTVKYLHIRHSQLEVVVALEVVAEREEVAGA
jgi:hypothetical protein